MADHAGEVDRGFHARVAAADDGDALAFEERSVAVRAVGDAAVAVLGFTGDADVAPAGAGREDHGPRAQAAAVGHLDLDETAGCGGRHDLLGALQIHDVDTVMADMRLEVGGETRALRLQHRDVVLDAQCVVGLAAEALGGDARAQALARGVDGCGCAGGSAADDQHVERRLGVDLGAILVGALRVETGDDLLEAHATRAEEFAVEEHHRHRHHLARRDLVLVERAVDDHGLDGGVEHRHQGQRLHHIRAVVAGEGHEHLEPQRALQAADGLEGGLVGLGRVAAAPQQRQHQRGELVAERHRCEMQRGLLAFAADLERGAALVPTVQPDRHLVGQAGDRPEQGAHLLRALGLIEGGDELDGPDHLREIGPEL